MQPSAPKHPRKGTMRSETEHRCNAVRDTGATVN